MSEQLTIAKRFRNYLPVVVDVEMLASGERVPGLGALDVDRER